MLVLSTPIYSTAPLLLKEHAIAIGAHVVIDATADKPVILGHGVQIGHQCYVGPGALLEDFVRLDTMSFVGKNTKIGKHSAVHSVKVFDDITIGENSFIGGEVSNWTVIGDHVTFMGRIVHTYRKAGSRTDWVNSPPRPSPIIRNYAVIGENALLVGGIEIGEGAYISVGEIVKYHVPAHHLAAHGELIPLEMFCGFIESRK